MSVKKEGKPQGDFMCVGWLCSSPEFLLYSILRSRDSELSECLVLNLHHILKVTRLSVCLSVRPGRQTGPKAPHHS